MLLKGSDLAGYIKERQAKTVRRLKQAKNIHPKLVILQTSRDPVIDSYTSMKKRYGEDIGAEVTVKKIGQSDLNEKIETLNEDSSVHGIIVQLPLENDVDIEGILNSVVPTKDVDGLGESSKFDSASATAVMWLLAGYNIELLPPKKIVVVGKGRLVGGPLLKMLSSKEYDVTAADISTKDLQGVVKTAQALITATGRPGLIKSEWIREGAVVIDAGTASERSQVVGDVDPVAYDRQDIKITPPKGGLGPLTICVLFENLIKTAEESR